MQPVWKRLASLPLVSVLFLSACGGKFFPKETGGGGKTSSGDYLYVANTSVNPFTIAAFSIANSKLNTISGSPFNFGAAQPSALVVTPKNTFLYVASVAGGIFGYSINSNGSLSVLNSGNALVTGILPSALKVDSTGSWLIAAQDNGSGSNGSAYLFAINTSTGALTAQGNAVTLDVGSPTRIVMTPNNQIVYISLATGGVDILAFNASSGVLNAPSQILHPKNSNNADYGLAIDSSGSYLFVTETGTVVNGTSGLRVLKIAANGGLTELSTSPVQTDLGPVAVLVSTHGYVYVASRTKNVIDGFALSANGALTALPNSPYSTGTMPVDLAEDNSHAYIAVACSGGTPDFQVFTIDTSASTAGQLVSLATASTSSTSPAGAAVVAATN